jgi:hypothetical protein
MTNWLGFLLGLVVTLFGIFDFIWAIRGKKKRRFVALGVISIIYGILIMQFALVPVVTRA